MTKQRNSLFASSHPCYVYEGYSCGCRKFSETIQQHRNHLFLSPACVIRNATTGDIRWLNSRPYKMPLHMIVTYEVGQNGDYQQTELLQTRDYVFDSREGIEFTPGEIRLSRILSDGWISHFYINPAEIKVLKFVPSATAEVFRKHPKIKPYGLMSPDGVIHECEFGCHGNLMHQLSSSQIDITGWVYLGDEIFFID